MLVEQEGNTGVSMYWRGLKKRARLDTTITGNDAV